MSNTRWKGLLLMVANALLPVAIGIFAIGFFPYKPFLPGRNVYRTEHTPQPKQVFDKLIFMVVDALRSDFVYSNESSFYYVQSLIRDGSALPFTAHAASPTITMPKIKAITTGSVPSFLDVILNFAESDTTSTLSTQDTWPSQLAGKPSGRILLYGDDTWLKLFPNVFSRHDGTSSFFVSDFTEVDNNVTRHIPAELDNTDWNGMIMHYLGLDHIGHKSGPRSPHMRPKQQEMDGIVRQVYEAIETRSHLRSTLLVLCGDHGMNEAGNHGGSASGETSPALVFMSPKFKKINKGLSSPVTPIGHDFNFYRVVEQSDVAPTLAGLLGFPIPLNNLGVFISSVLDMWPSGSDQVQLLQQNAEQIYDIVKATFGETLGPQSQSMDECNQNTNDGNLLHCMYFAATAKVKSSVAAAEKLNHLTQFLEKAQDIMSSAASNYDVGKLQRGVCFATLATLIVALLAMSTSFQSMGTMISMFALCVAHGVMMFASSFVEEEHHFWYWSSTTWMTLLWSKCIRRAKIGWRSQVLENALLLATFRIVRRWNQTGQKHAGAPDIARTFLASQPRILWLLIILTYLNEGRNLNKVVFTKYKIQLLLPLLALLSSAAGFKASFTAADAPELLTPAIELPLRVLANISLLIQARAVFFGITWFLLAMLAQNRVLRRSSKPYSTLYGLHSLLTILLITQSRANNIPLFLVFNFQLFSMRSASLGQDSIIFASLLMQHTSYFAFGGTNAISSIDLSSAYNGVGSYNVLAVGILTFIGNWAGPIWWSAGCCILLHEKCEGSAQSFFHYLVLQTLFVSSGLMTVMMACTLLRTHLFIWTVFSPKYLYIMAWSLGQHFVINILLGSLIWMVGKDR